MDDVTNLNNFTFGFFNSVNGDRKYEAKEFATIFEGIIQDGVYESVGDRFMVKESAIPDNKVQILEGRAWLNNIWVKNDSVNVITLPDPGLVLDRIDAVCIEINESNIRTSAGTPGRAANIIVVSGVEASSPARPNLVNDEDVHQYALAYVYRRNGRDTTVRQSNITNNVGSTELPFVTGPLKTHDISEMVAQWESQFDNWMNEQSQEFLTWIDINKEILDSHIGGAIIDSLTNRLNNTYTKEQTYSKEEVYSKNEMKNLMEFANPGHHNSIYRGKDIQQYYNDGSLWNRIQGANGYELFDDLYIGDYFTITIPADSSHMVDRQEVKCLIAHFDYYYGFLASGNINDFHHVVIVPENSFKETYSMSSSTSDPTTVGGYNSSTMYTNTIKNVYSPLLANIFGDHMKYWWDYVSDAVNNSIPSMVGNGYTGGVSHITTVNHRLNLMSALQLGFPVGSSYLDLNTAGSQFALFRLDNSKYIAKRTGGTASSAYWLRTIFQRNEFMLCATNGVNGYASNAVTGFRPYWLLG